MSPRVVGIVYRKELRETLRDRRTLLVMLLLPMVLYPLIGIGLTEWIGAREEARAAAPSRVGLRGAAWPELEEKLRRSSQLVLLAEGGIEEVRRGELDLLVEVGEAGPSARLEGTTAVELQMNGVRPSSVLAAERLRKLLGALNRDLREQRLRQRRLSPALVEPLRTETRDLASRQQVTTQVLAGVLPLLLVLMILLGAFYPAIDLTAGEKERGTLETLLVSPASRIDLITGKYLAVSTIAIITGLLNLASIAVTAGLGFGAALRAAGLGSVPWSAIALALLALLPTALFFAALMLAVASLARSFKEAQNLLTPVYLACILPALAAQVPGLELSPLSALVPVANVALLTRDLIGGRISVLPLVLTLGSTLLYAAVALRIAARIYNSERMLFAPDRVKSTRPRRLRLAPEPAEAALVLLAVMALILLVGQQVQARHLIGGILLTEWALIAAPVLLLIRFGRLDGRASLHLRRPAASSIGGALLAGISAWYLVGVLVERLQERILPMPPEVLREMQRVLFDSGRPLAVDLLALALSPAICEELLFRGVLLRASWPALRWPAAVLLNGLLFGLFHLSAYRFFSTFLLGLLLALIVVRSGSIYPAMLFHLLNNGAALIVGRLLSRSGSGAREPALQLGWLLAAAVVFALGMLLVMRQPIRPEPAGPPDRSG